MFLYSLVIHELAHVHTSLKNSWRPSLQTEHAQVSRYLKKVAPLRVIAIEDLLRSTMDGILVA